MVRGNGSAEGGDTPGLTKLASEIQTEHALAEQHTGSAVARRPAREGNA